MSISKYYRVSTAVLQIALMLYCNVQYAVLMLALLRLPGALEGD